jgi:hypothetical protein
VDAEIKLKAGPVDVPVQVHDEVFDAAGVHGADDVQNPHRGGKVFFHKVAPAIRRVSPVR